MNWISYSCFLFFFFDNSKILAFFILYSKKKNNNNIDVLSDTFLFIIIKKSKYINNINSQQPEIYQVKTIVNKQLSRLCMK